LLRGWLQGLPTRRSELPLGPAPHACRRAWGSELYEQATARGASAHTVLCARRPGNPGESSKSQEAQSWWQSTSAHPVSPGPTLPGPVAFTPQLPGAACRDVGKLWAQETLDGRERGGQRCGRGSGDYDHMFLLGHGSGLRGGAGPCDRSRVHAAPSAECSLLSSWHGHRQPLGSHCC